MKAAIYIRVSTEEQSQNGTSLTTQKKDCIEYAEKNNFEIFKVYSDEGLSGADFKNRPGLNQLLVDAGNQKFDTAIFWWVDS